MEKEIKIDIVRELSQLYELSLAVGNSLDLWKTCEDFLNVWMRQKNIDFGSVWLNNEHLNKPIVNNYSLIYAHPDFRIAQKEITPNHSIINQLEENRAIFVNSEMAHFQEFITEKNVFSGCYWVIPLPNLGFIKFYYSKDNHSQNAFDFDEVKKASKLIQKFCIALRSCLLHNLVRENQTELKEAKEKVEEASRIKQEFLSVVSHEIRTPLNAIIGMTNLIQKSSLTPQQADYINTVQISADNLQGIINTILDFSKIEAGKMSLQKIPFNLKKTLQNIISSNEFKAEQKGIGLFLKFDEKADITLIGDPIRLSQVLLNLVSNAIKFTASGKIVIEVRHITKMNNALVAEFSVSDTGKGIVEEMQKIIFESFTQEDSSISRKYGGTGLGLSISKQLVELMGGDLRVKSDGVNGSVFSFVVGFPISQEPLLERKEKNISENLLIGKRVLLVEDNAMNQFFAQKLLEGWGIKVEIAQNGKEGVEKFKIKHYDGILMDIQMPEMDGFQATKAIRKENTLIPIIALTAMMVQTETERFKEVGMNDHIIKPFVAEELQQKLIQHITHPLNYSISSPQFNIKATERLYNNQLLLQMMKGNSAQVRQMENLFMQQATDTIKQMRDCFEQKKWTLIGLSAHKIKASIDMLQINSLKLPIRTLEVLEKQKKAVEEIDSLVRFTTQTLTKVCAEIESSHQ